MLRLINKAHQYRVRAEDCLRLSALTRNADMADWYESLADAYSRRAEREERLSPETRPQPYQKFRPAPADGGCSAGARSRSDIPGLPQRPVSVRHRLTRNGLAEKRFG